MPLPRSGHRMRSWAIGLIPLIVVAAVLAVVLIRSRDGAGGPADQSRPGPVLRVAGVGGSIVSLQVLAADLRAKGRTAVVVSATGTNTGDLNDQARTLDRAAREQIRAGAPSVDGVGYSAGGVVARIWADQDGAGVARRVITLGSPHHGTDVAGLAAGLAASSCPVACRQLAPGSPLLAGLPETPSAARWVSIYTADDETVIPVTTARLQGAVNIELQQICSGVQVSHGQLPKSPLTIGLVELALDGPPIQDPPGASQCAALTR